MLSTAGSGLALAGSWTCRQELALAACEYVTPSFLHAQSPAHWPGCFDFVNRPRCTVAAMLTIAAVIVSVFFAVWNPEEIYVGQEIICP
jgi:hypothetical protein